jgi:ElaB/YqjD/DUF883 family membrane-anchored ribosome-binding protein
MQNRITDERFGARWHDRRAAAGDELADLADATRRQLADAGRAVEAFVAAHPAACLAAAVSMGILFGWWVKRQ